MINFIRQFPKIIFLSFSLLSLFISLQTILAEENLEVGLKSVGKDLFTQHCSSCHGLNGQGDGPVASTLRTKVPDLTLISKNRDGTFPKSDIAMIIDGRLTIPTHGSRAMPVWGTQLAENMSDSELRSELVRGKIAALVEYIESIQK